MMSVVLSWLDAQSSIQIAIRRSHESRIVGGASASYPWSQESERPLIFRRTPVKANEAHCASFPLLLLVVAIHCSLIMFSRLLATALGALALLSFVVANQVAGTATFTGGNLSGGACLYYNYTLPRGIYGTAINLNNTPYQCGTCLKVIGSQGSIVVMVCPLPV